jgi:hypothetical protein
MKRLLWLCFLFAIAAARSAETNYVLATSVMYVPVEAREADGTLLLLPRGTAPFRFGLYAGPTNAPESALELICLFTNTVVTPSMSQPPSKFLHFVNTNFPPSSLVTVQVRAWPMGLGMSYEEASTNAAAPAGFFGKTPVATMRLVPPPGVPPKLFGFGALFKEIVLKRRSVP